MTQLAHDHVGFPTPAARPGRASPSRRAGARFAQTYGPWVLLAAALAFWAISVPQIDDAAIDSLGLISALPWTMVPAFGLTIVGLLVAISGKTRTGAAYAMIVMLVLLLHGTPALVYENLRYEWAWKHLGVIEFIERTGTLDPWSRYLAAYHNWPGFFLLFAGVGKLFHFDSLAMSQIARFFPLGLNILYASVLPYILRRMSTDRRLVWTGTALFVVGNWVGQDYFSPQGTAFLCLLVILALCLGPLATIPHRPAPRAPRALFHLWRLRLWSTRRAPILPKSLPTREKLVATGIVLALILAIIASHQLTPLLMIAMLTGLFVIGRIGIGFVLFAIVAEVLWLFFIADPFVGRIFPTLLGEIGAVGQETFTGVVDWATVSEGQRVVSLASRSIVVAMGVLAAAGFLARWRGGYRDGIAAVLALAPLPLAISTSYGGEIVFRVYFFALPFLSFFAAALFFPTPKMRLTPFVALALAVVLGGFSWAFILANNGKDAQYRFSASEVAAAQWLFESAEPNTLLIEGAAAYPRQFEHYENMVYVPLTGELGTIGEALATDPASLLAGWMREHTGPAFAIFTRSQNAYYEAMNLLEGTSLVSIVDKLLASPDFNVAFAGRDAIVFRLAPPAEPGVQPQDLAREMFQLPKLNGFNRLRPGPVQTDKAGLLALEQERLTAALVAAGYRDAEVVVANEDVEPNVVGGPLYRIGAVGISGLDLPASNTLPRQISDVLAGATGQPATQITMQAMVEDVSWVLEEAGYPYADVRLGTITEDQATQRLSVQIEARPGAQERIGSTAIVQGWPEIDHASLTTIELPEDVPYSRTRINALYDAMMALPNVSAVHIALTPASAGIVDLVVRLDPIRGPAWFENETAAIVLLITALVGIAIFEAVNSTGHGRHKRELALRAAITGSLVVISTAYVLLLLNMIGAWPI